MVRVKHLPLLIQMLFTFVRSTYPHDIKWVNKPIQTRQKTCTDSGPHKHNLHIITFLDPEEIQYKAAI